ncbi:MAG: hypothetical protein K6A44_02295 [bacterium]|nr:hypothetical protein [bacterium]
MKKLLMILFLIGFMAMPCFSEEEANQDNQNTVFSKEEIVTTKSFNISSIDPTKANKANQGLVIFTKLYGNYTGTDTKGYEAVIVDNRVVQLNQSNSYIPKNGYVISGHGEAKKFIINYMFEGADVEIDFDNAQVKVVTHPDNYLYEAKYRYDTTKEAFEKADKTDLNVELIEFYLARANNLLETTKKLIVFKDYENAAKMAQDSITYSDKALYYMFLYDENEFKGIKVFPYQKNEAEIKQAFATISRLGIKNIFIEGYYNGFTIYKSDVQEKYNLPIQNRYYGEFDPLAVWIALAKENNKNIYVTINAFDLGNILKSSMKSSIVAVYPEWIYKTRDGKYYLNPSNDNVQRYLMALVDEVSKKYEIAGINITGLNIPMDSSALYIKDFVNKVSGYQRINEKIDLIVDVYPFITDIKNWNIDGNITLSPVLTSTDLDFTKNFLTEVQENALGARILPVYTEPYLEVSPRNLFEQLSVAREMGIKGIILYNNDYMNKEFADALKCSVFDAPQEQKQQTNAMQINFNTADDKATEAKEPQEAKEEKSEAEKIPVNEEVQEILDKKAE